MILAGKDSSLWRLLTGPAGPGQIALIIVASFALSVWLIGAQVTNAHWGLIDDHDTLNFIGLGNHHLPINRYFNVLLSQTEMGEIGSYPRFRPFYYPALLFEAMVWGDNVHLWYACNVALFAIFIASVWIGIARYSSAIFGLAVVIYILDQPYWGDIWARLGPGEIYAAVGFGIWIIGLLGMFTAKRTRAINLGIFAVTLGTVMMVGSKETTFPFLGYTACALGAFILMNRRSSAAKISLIFILTYGVTSAYIIYLALSKSGHDFLGRPIGMTERLTQLIGPFAHSALEFLLPSIVLCALTALPLRKRVAAERAVCLQQWANLTVIYLIGVLGVWSLYLSQYVGYNGVWPTGMRYDFPGQLALPAFVSISLIYVMAALPAAPYVRSALQGGVTLASVITIGFILSAAPFPLAKAVALNIQITSKFYDALRQMVDLAQANPEEPFILRANGAWSYEKIASMAQYLRFFGVTNPIAVHFVPDNKNDVTFQTLSAIIQSWEKNGRQYMVPLTAVRSAAQSGCLSVGLDGPVEAGCSGVEM